MTVKFNFNVDDANIKRKLSRVSNRSLIRNGMRRAGADIIRWIQENFDQEGGLSRPWKQNTPLTAEGKTTGKVLTETGRLKNSFRVKRVTADRIDIESDVFYAKFHEFGTADDGIIEPKNAPALGPIGDGRFFKRVQHRGVPVRRMSPPRRVVREILKRNIINKLVEAGRG